MANLAMVTHRLANVVAADLIVVLEEGRVVEQGSHNDLIARQGRYRDLWRRQTVRLDQSAEACASRI